MLSDTFTELMGQYGDIFLKDELSKFLTSSDILNLRLAHSSLSCCDIMSPSMLPSLAKTSLNWEEHKYTKYTKKAKEWYALPITIPSSKIHTVFFRGQWKDQGWGNQKGMVAIVASGVDHRAPNDYCSPGPGVVAHKSPAPHEWDNFQLVFEPNPSHHLKNTTDGEEEYTIWIRRGDGGGHTLHLKNLQMSMLVKRQS